MNSFDEKLLLLEEALTGYPLITAVSLQQAARALETIEAFNRDLCGLVSSIGFATPGDEIRYFRHQRPRLTSHWMYFSRVHWLEAHKPGGTLTALRAAYENQLRWIDTWFEHDRKFIGYLRSGKTHLDGLYFLRENAFHATIEECCYPAFDPGQTTIYDIKAGRLIACEWLSAYCHERIRELEPAADPQTFGQTPALPTKLNEEKLLRSWQVERKLAISRSTLHVLRKSGQIAFLQVRRTIWYRESDVQDFIERNQYKDLDDKN